MIESDKSMSNVTRQHDEDGTEENTAVRSIVLMSTLATAADVMHGMSERRHGRDPSAQEDEEVAATFIRAAAIELKDHLLALRASRVLSDDDDAAQSVRISRRMNEVMILNYIARLLHVVHQRALSLYPALSEELVEEARILHGECTAMRDEEEAVSFDGFVERAQDFCGALRSSV